MLRFGFPERTGRCHLGYHLARPEAGGLDIGDRVLRNSLLLFTRIEDRRPVAHPDVVALAIAGCRVVNLEENLEQLSIADPGRIEDDLDGFGVRPVLAVRRIGDVAPRIADPRRDDARVFPNEILHPPKASAGEHRAFRR